MQPLHTIVLPDMAVVVVPVNLLPIVSNIVVVVTAGHNTDRGVEVEAGNVWRIAMALAVAVAVEERDLGVEAEAEAEAEAHHRTIKIIIRINQHLVNIGAAAAAVVEKTIGRVSGIKSVAGGIIIEDGTIVVQVVGVVGVIIRAVVMVIIEGMALPHNIAPIIVALEDREEEEDTIEEAVRVVVRG